MKFTEVECNDFDITVSLPIATNQQISPIEYLSVDHPCAVDALFAIISYTPQVRRLKCLNVTNSNVNIRGIQPMAFSNLTQFSIQSYEMSFNEFKIFIRKLNSKLKVLSLSTIVEDIAFLDAHQWEEFILKDLSQLEKFYFKYTSHFDIDYATPMYSGKQNQFISSFWLEQRWILETEIDFDNLIYSIRPYKYVEKQCFHIEETRSKRSVELYRGRDLQYGCRFFGNPQVGLACSSARQHFCGGSSTFNAFCVVRTLRKSMGSHPQLPKKRRNPPFFVKIHGFLPCSSGF
jgi:hypothetical protein